MMMASMSTRTKLILSQSMKMMRKIAGLKEADVAAIEVAPEAGVTSEVAAEETTNKVVEVAIPNVETTEEVVAAKEEAIVINPEEASPKEAAETMVIVIIKMRKKANGKIT